MMFLCTLATTWAKISSIYSKITKVGGMFKDFPAQNHTLCLRIFFKKSDLLERHIPVCLTPRVPPPPPGGGGGEVPLNFAKIALGGSNGTGFDHDVKV